MAATKGFDCATPITEQIASTIPADRRFIGRYLVQTGAKRLTAEEAKIITQAGREILSFFEHQANRALGGWAAGVPDGAEALNAAKRVGQPEGSAIYPAIDFDAQSNQMDVIERYLRGFKSQLPNYKVRCYGSYSVIEEMVRRGVIDAGCQTYAWSKVNGQVQVSSHAVVYQYSNDQSLAGIQVDLDESYGNEGFWNLNPPKVDPANVPIVYNGKTIATGTLVQGTTSAPVRDVAEGLGYTVGWDGQKVTIQPKGGG